MWRPLSSRIGHDTSAWPVLLLLLGAVLIPTACVLWLLQDAAGSQQILARQRLGEAYSSQIGLFRQNVEAWWDKRLLELDQWAERNPAPAVFARIAREGIADSSLIYSADKRLVYPAGQPPPGADPLATHAGWNRARDLEGSDPSGAAAAYAHLARDTIAGGRALQGQARCLMALRRRESVVQLVTERFAGNQFERAADVQGRLIAADLELLALRLIGKPGDPRFAVLAARLARRLDDYGNTAIGAPQRRFLMSELRSLGLPAPPSYEAEQTASRYLENGPDGEWFTLRTPKGRVVVLLRPATALRQIAEFAGAQRFPQGVHAVALLPGAKAPGSILTETAAGPRFPGLRLALWSAEADPAGTLAQGSALAYFWVGLLAIATTVVLALLVARAIQRQMRLARLKTDLVATVSHELKTPLASICLLVDTLLDDPQPDPVKTREYLELIAKENARLTHLIDNFLTFSRMERGRRRFDFREMRPEEVVHAAAEAMRERFSAPGCRLEIEIEPELPAVSADEGGLVTTLTNLLDNAWKYSGDEKCVTLRAYRDGSQVCFAVEDNGIGIPARETQKIFRRFYQVDRRLARERGGCGLGLSIVEFIVRAHGGSISVASQVGKGSTFTVTLPGVTQGAGA